VWWLVAAKVAAALAFALLIPFFRGPDEVLHLSLLRWYGANPGYPNPTEFLSIEPELLATGVPQAGGGVLRPPLQVDEAVPRPDRPTLGELEAVAGPPPPPTNQLSQHPPLYYVATDGVGGMLTSILPDGAWSWDRLSLLYRWMSVLTLAPLPLVASSAALAVGLDRRAGAVAAAVVFAAPSSSALAAVITNDNLTIVLSGVAVACALRWLRRPSARPWAIAAAVAAGLAVSTKSTALIVLVWVVAVAAIPVVRAYRARAPVADLLRTWGLVVGVGIVGSWWQITQWVRFGTVQPSAYSGASRPGVDVTLADFVGEWLSLVPASFWGAPAPRTGVALPMWVALPVSVVVAVLIGIAVVAPLRRRRGRLVPLLLSALVVPQAALMVRANWSEFSRAEAVSSFQGRYLFVVLIPLAVLVALGVVEVLRYARGRVDALGVAVGVTVVGVAFHLAIGLMMLARFWGPPGGTWGAHLDALLAWSPLPVLATLVVLSVPLWLALIGGGVAWRQRGRATPSGALPRRAA